MNKDFLLQIKITRGLADLVDQAVECRRRTDEDLTKSAVLRAWIESAATAELAAGKRGRSVPRGT